MKFIDEARIQVVAGNGGHGCLSFRREKFIEFGGPDGGNGGVGGSVYLVGKTNLNTLIEFRYQRKHAAQNGACGEGALRTGKSGEDLFVPVPLGTVVYDADTEERLGEIIEADTPFLVAQGGRYGLGNAHFKSSTNRAPRHTTRGQPGETRFLHLELRLLADVGLVGLPNAGKSTLIRAVSNATPKVADYPFTTLHPHLGVVRVGELRSFVMADIPGLIEGASEGAGLGAQFLRHVSRTALLLQVVDMLPPDGSDPIDAIRIIEHELQNFSPELAERPRWLVLNKKDLFLPEEWDVAVQKLRDALSWAGPLYAISAIAKQGTEALMRDVMEAVETLSERQHDIDEQRL